MQVYIVTFLTCVPDHRGTVADIVEYIKQPKLPDLIRRFLYYQFSNDSNTSDSDVPISALPTFNNKLFLRSSAASVFFAPSDPSGINGLRQEQIRSTWNWRGGPSRQDTVLVDTGDGGNMQLPMSGYVVARVLLFFSFTYAGNDFPVALVWWYTLSDNSGRRDRATGMWLVEREYRYRNREPHLAVVHVDTIFRAVHLLPYFGYQCVPRDVTCDNSLDSYAMFYVNRYADHQSFEIL